MSKFCKKIAVIFIVLGCIISLILAYHYGLELHSTIKYRNWATTILIFISGILVPSIFGLFIYWMGEVVERLTNIETHIKNISSDNK